MYSMDFYIPQYKIPKVKYIKGNIYNVSTTFHGKKFDFIILKEVIEHLFNPDTVLISLKTLLNENGLLFISTPNKGSFFNRIMLFLGYLPLCDEVSTVVDVGKYGKYNRKGVCNGHIRTFTFKSLIELLDYHGFKVKSATTVPSQKGENNTFLISFERALATIDKRLGSSIIVVCSNNI